MTLHTRHRRPVGPGPKMTTDYCIVIQDQGLYQFSEFFIFKKCLKSSAQDLITDGRESELKKSVNKKIENRSKTAYVCKQAERAVSMPRYPPRI